MAIKAFTKETNYCDFCGRECDISRLFMVAAGLSLTRVDWKEIVCEDCEPEKLGFSPLTVFPLSSLLAS